MHLMLEYTDRAIVISGGHVIADGKSSAILTDERITEAASLKRTSLYDLAVRCGIESPEQLTDRFIHYERSIRTVRAAGQAVGREKPDMADGEKPDVAEGHGPDMAGGHN